MKVEAHAPAYKHLQVRTRSGYYANEQLPLQRRSRADARARARQEAVRDRARQGSACSVRAHPSVVGRPQGPSRPVREVLRLERGGVRQQAGARDPAARRQVRQLRGRRRLAERPQLATRRQAVRRCAVTPWPVTIRDEAGQDIHPVRARPVRRGRLPGSQRCVGEPRRCGHVPSASRARLTSAIKEQLARMGPDAPRSHDAEVDEPAR